MKLKIKLITSAALVMWGYSLFWVRSTTWETCSRLAYSNAYDAYDLGQRETRGEISRSPYVSGSLWASEGLSFQVQDTYFAKGNDLLRSLQHLADSEGLKHYRSSGPTVHIQIDGSDEGIELSIMVSRETCFNISDYLSFDSDSDKHIKDLVFIHSNHKLFSANTSYKEVEQWLHAVCKSVCEKIKERNAVVLEKLKKHSKNEGKSWFKEREYRYKYL